MKPEKCRECGAELRLRPATCPLCGCELKPEDSWNAPGNEEDYHSNVRQLRDELKRLREEAQSA
jgi:hypothetical protein